MSTRSNNPYIGPRPFQKDEAKRFFGRDREARDLLALVSSQRLVLFYASSGAGKSSLINARLIDALEGRGFEIMPVGRVSGVLPRDSGVDPDKINVFAYFLKQSLAEFRLEDAATEEGWQRLQDYAGTSLSEFLLRLAHAGKDDQGIDRYRFTALDGGDDQPALALADDVNVELKPRALIVDQFEEIFTTNLQAWEQRGDFFSQLRQAMEDDPYLWVVLAMREDFIANLDPLAHLLPGDLHARYYMQRMGYSAALEAVKKPVETRDPDHPEWYRPFAPGVAEKLVNNLRQVHVTSEEGEGVATATGEFIEPVQLQVVCFQLWEQLRETPGAEITDADLDRLAGGQDLSVFIDRALGEFYEQALRRVLEKAGDRVNEMALRRWFSERLITEAGTRGFVYRGEQETGGLPNDVVRLLAAEFLIRSESRAGGTWYELSHDRFVDPIQRSNQRWSLEQLQRDPLLRRAHEWAASAEEPAQRNAGLLLTDDELATLDLSGRAAEPVVEEFVEASRRAKEQRDLAAARRNEKRSLQRSIVLGAWSLVAVLAFIFAAFQGSVATTERDKAIEAEKTAKTAQAASDASAADAEQARKEAEVDRRIARSLLLANQSLDTSSPEDRLLLARAATEAYSSTLLASAALVGALDDSYRLTADGSMTPYVPHEPLGIATDRPWRSLAFSHDGRLLALGDDNGGVTLWDNANGQPIGRRTVAHGAYRVYALAFDPTGPRLVSATGDLNNPTAARHDLALWDLSDPAAPTYRTLARGRPAMWSAAWSPDGQQVAVANQDGTVDLWSNLSGTEPISRTLPGRHSDWAFSVAFDPGGERLASAGVDGVIFLWSELGSSQPLSDTLRDHTAWVNVVAFSPDGTQLASGSDDGTLRLWDMTQDPPSSRVLDDHADQGIEVWDLAFSADGARLAAGWGDNLARVYDLQQSGAPPGLLAGHGGEVMHVAFDPSAPQRLVSLGLDDPAPIAWDLSRYSEFAAVQPLALPEGAAVRAISSTGQWLAVGEDRHTVWLGNALSSSPAISYTADMTITAAALSGDGARVALAGCLDTLPPVATEVAATPVTTDTQKSLEAAGQSGSRLTGCLLTVSSAEAGKAVSPTYTITSPQRIDAVAFRPLRPDQWAIALESGDVQTSGGFAAGARNLTPRVLGAVDLAFDSTGQQLAALGRDGVVTIWNWTTGEVVAENSPDESQLPRLFDAIAFVRGNDWLALASNGTGTPQLALWERKTRTLVDRFRLDGAAADLAVSAGGETLTAALPGRVVRWPMDQARWLELACDRAGRNLSYDAWRKAFPNAEQDDTKDALICDGYPLDVSFSEALVDEADQALDDCRPRQLEDGMALLRRAAADQRLELDLTAHALEVLTGKALEQLRQRTYDDKARECLNVAAQLVTFDPQRAFLAASNLVQAERLLASSQQADLGAAVDKLEAAVDLSPSWPDRSVEEAARRLLPDAYYRACQQGDEHACQSATDFVDMLGVGDTIPDQLVDGRGPSLYFQGRRGQAVTIAMNADNNAFDTYLRLEGPAGASISDDDGGPDLNSLIANYLLPQDGIYRIVPTSYGGGGSGAYSIEFNLIAARSLTPGSTETATPGAGSLWQFEGHAGQLVAVALNAADPNSDPYLRLIGPDLQPLASDDDSGGNRNALVVTTLPQDGPYYVSAERLEGDAAFTLRLIEPQPLAWDEPQAAVGDASALWQFEGARGQLVDLAATPADGAPPRLILRNTNGASLVEREGWIAAQILPADGRYVLEARPAAGQTPYTLTLASITAPALAFDQAVTSTTQADPIWTFTGQAGQIVDLALNSDRLTFDPELALLNGGGNEIAHDYDGGGDLNARIAAFILPADGQYFVRPLPAGRPVSYTLALRAVAPQAIAPDGAATASTLRQDTLWAFDGQLGQPIAVSASTPTGAVPRLAIQAASGETLVSPQSSAITAFFPPETGRYYLRVADIDQTTRYDLALQTLEPPVISFGEPVTSTTQANDLWRFTGQAGQVVTIDMTGWVPGGFDPYVYLLAADGRTLIENEDISWDNYNARIAAFILPTNGDYYVRAGMPARGRTTDPYTLVLQEVSAPELWFGQPASSNTQTAELWRFSGRAGQVVDIELTGSDFDPSLTLYDDVGNVLAANDNISAENWNARIAAFILPDAGDYYIRAGRPGSTAPYRLSLTERRPAPAVLGSTLQAPASTAFALPVQRPGFVSISVDPTGELSLSAPDGTALASQAPAILARLDASGVYTVAASFPADGRPRSIAMLPIAATARPLSATGSNQGRLRAGSTDLWTLAGGEAQAVRVTARGADFTPALALYAPGGELRAVSDSNGVLVAALPATGESVLALRGPAVEANGPYTLTVQLFSALPGPQACVPNSNAVSYLPVRVGSPVILGRHRPVNGEEGWSAGMNAYVGQQATVTGLAGSDWLGCPQVQVDIDQGQFYWRVRDLLVLE